MSLPKEVHSEGDFFQRRFEGDFFQRRHSSGGDVPSKGGSFRVRFLPKEMSLPKEVPSE
jgi:hypothetical protein